MRKRNMIKKRSTALLMAAILGTTCVPAASPAPAAVLASQQETEKTEMAAEFDFDNGIGGWYYGNGWEYDYSAKDTSSVEADDGRLKFNVDYTGDKDKGWSQATAVWEPEDGKGMNLSGADGVTMNLIYVTVQVPC